MTALVDTLFQLEKYLGLELDSLLPFAEMDDIGGYHPDPTQRKWGAGAIWEVEGQTIYALIRALKPETVVEIGSGTGCSTTHIAAALLCISQYHKVTGHIVTIDRGNTPQIPDDLKSFVTILGGDAIEWLQQQPDNSIDFILEDADHSEAMCYQVGELAKTKLRPGGVLMVHDAVHPTVGADVRAGYDRAGLDVRTYLTDPSDCGWAVWQRPDLNVPLMEDLNAAIQEIQTEKMNDWLKSGKFNRITVEDGHLVKIEELPNPFVEAEDLKAQEKSASLADTEPVLQAQEDQRSIAPEIVEGIKILTDALHDDEPTEEKVTKLLNPPPAKKKPVRKAKAKAKK